MTEIVAGGSVVEVQQNKHASPDGPTDAHLGLSLCNDLGSTFLDCYGISHHFTGSSSSPRKTEHVWACIICKCGFIPKLVVFHTLYIHQVSSQNK